MLFILRCFGGGDWRKGADNEEEMARISAQDFVGTRTRFQRLRDAKLFTGWIEDFFGNKVVVSSNTQFPVAVGDEFRFEGFGHHISVVFQARLESVGQLSLVDAGTVTAIEGTNAQIIEARRVSFHLGLVGPVRFSASKENLRMRSTDLFVTLQEGPVTHEGFAIDVSEGGIGVVCKSRLKAKEFVKVRIETRYGAVEAGGNIRYCLPDKDREGMYRIGVMFMDMDRVNKPRWERYLEKAA